MTPKNSLPRTAFPRNRHSEDASTSGYTLNGALIPLIAPSDHPPSDSDELELTGWILAKALRSKWNDTHALVETKEKVIYTPII